MLRFGYSAKLWHTLSMLNTAKFFVSIFPLLLTLGMNLSACHSAPTSPPTLSARATEIKTQLNPPATPEPIQTSPRPASPTTFPPTPQIMPTLSPLDPILITHGDRSQPYVALTFDACQSAGEPAGYDAAIISILTATKTPATLFLGGLWMQRYPAQTQALAANPLLELGNHSWSHPDFTQLNPAKMSTEIMDTQQLLYSLTGQQATLFRFPFDIYTDEAMAIVGQHGLRAISGDVISGDPDPNVSVRAMVQEITSQVDDGSIIIMHMNTRGQHTAEALPEIISQLREARYTFVTVSQLLDLAPPPTSP